MHGGPDDEETRYRKKEAPGKTHGPETGRKVVQGA